MSDHHYRPGYGGGRRGNAQMLQEEESNRPRSRLPRPGINHPDRMRGPPSMAPNFSASPIRSPPRAPAIPVTQQNYHLPQDYEEDYSQIDQWPLQEQYAAHTTRGGSNSPRTAPRRPARPEESSQRLIAPLYMYGGEPQSRMLQPRRMLQTMPQGREPHLEPPTSHYGHQQTAGEVRGWSPSPPQESQVRYTAGQVQFSGAPSTSHEDLTAMPSYPLPQVPQQAASRQQQENRRAPLGPPPLARRPMPSSYYPQVGPVYPIAEETDSLRGSARTGSVNTGGHDSKTSFASSNAIPIGISQTHLERGREAAYPPVRRPAPLSDTDDEEYGDSPTEPAIARGEIRTPDYTHNREQNREQPSPEHAIVRQASLGKRSKPTLTTVKSSDQVRKSSGEAKGAVATLPNQQQRAIRDVATEDIERAAKARALTREMLEGNDHIARYSAIGGEGPPSEQVQSGASNAKVQQNDYIAKYSALRPPGTSSEQVQAGASNTQTEQHSHRNQQQPDNADVTAHLQDGRNRGMTNDSDASYVTNPYPSTSAQPDEQKAEAAPRSGPGAIRRSPDAGDNIKRQRAHPGKLDLADISDLPHPQHPPLASTVDPRVEFIADSLEKGGALSAEEARELKEPMGGLSGRAGKRRPPRLNMTAVEEAEARGSLTSMTDMILRATRVASNLDRGRTASRLGMDWMGDAGSGEKGHRSGSMSDIIAGFPQPALATPPGSRNTIRRSLAAFSSKGNRHSELASDSDAGEVKRSRCCSMPLWLLIVLLLLLFLIVALAIVLPVVFIVIPNQANAGQTKVGSCAANILCDNGGTNILGSNGACECLCVNGYTGATCSTYQQLGCTSISVHSSSNATIGEAIPRLLDGAESDYGVPLDSEELLGLFSRLDMTCNAQNALVTFNGRSTERSLASTSELGGEISRIFPRQDTTTITTPTSHTLDFARIAVLYVFQTSQKLQIAADAQEGLRPYLQYNASLYGQAGSASNVTLGNGYSANLASFYLTTDNGTIVGGK